MSTSWCPNLFTSWSSYLLHWCAYFCNPTLWGFVHICNFICGIFTHKSRILVVFVHIFDFHSLLLTSYISPILWWYLRTSLTFIFFFLLLLISCWMHTDIPCCSGIFTLSWIPYFSLCTCLNWLCIGKTSCTFVKSDLVFHFNPSFSFDINENIDLSDNISLVDFFLWHQWEKKFKNIPHWN